MSSEDNVDIMIDLINIRLQLASMNTMLSERVNE